MSAGFDLVKDATLKANLLAGLHAFVAQRPGLAFGNYGTLSAYRSEMRSITQDLHDARELLRAVELSSLPGAGLQAAFGSAYRGRLSAEVNPDTLSVRLDYCTGQYWPTEYRRAVCAVAAQALWVWYREDFATSCRHNEYENDAVRRKFKEWFGKRIQQRWFN